MPTTRLASNLIQVAAVAAANVTVGTTLPVIDNYQVEAGDYVLLTAQIDPNTDGLYYGTTNGLVAVDTYIRSSASISSSVFFANGGVNFSGTFWVFSLGAWSYFTSNGNTLNAPFPTGNPVNDTANLTAALYAAGVNFAATGARTVVSFPDGLYSLNSYLVWYSGTELKFSLNTELSLQNGSNTNIVVNYAAINPNRTVTDGAITAGTNVLTSTQANWTVLDQGRWVSVPGALAASTPLQAKIGEVSLTGNSVSLVDPLGNPLVAWVTVSAVTVSIIQQDSWMILDGGQFNRNNNGGGTTGTSQGPSNFTARLEFIDHITIQNTRWFAGTATGYQCHLGAVFDFKLFNNWGYAPSTTPNTDVFNIHGPAYVGVIERSRGSGGDDFVSLHTVDGTATLVTTAGNLVGIQILDTAPNGLGVYAVKVHADKNTTCSGIRIVGVHGAYNNGIGLLDFSNAPSSSWMADTFIDDVDLEIQSTTGNAVTLYLGSPPQLNGVPSVVSTVVQQPTNVVKIKRLVYNHPVLSGPIGASLQSVSGNVASGTPPTSLPVSALTVALPAGLSFSLFGDSNSTKTTFTLTQAVGIGATSLPVSCNVTSITTVIVQSAGYVLTGCSLSGTTLTCSTAAFTAADVGRSVIGTGISSGSVISAYISSTQVTISKALTTEASVTVNFSALGTFVVNNGGTAVIVNGGSTLGKLEVEVKDGQIGPRLPSIANATTGAYATLNQAVSAGAPPSSLTVTALPAPIPLGYTFTVSTDTNSPPVVWTVTAAAAAGATTLAVQGNGVVTAGFTNGNLVGSCPATVTSYVAINGTSSSSTAVLDIDVEVTHMDSSIPITNIIALNNGSGTAADMVVNLIKLHGEVYKSTGTSDTNGLVNINIGGSSSALNVSPQVIDTTGLKVFGGGGGSILTIAASLTNTILWKANGMVINNLNRWALIHNGNVLIAELFGIDCPLMSVSSGLFFGSLGTSGTAILTVKGAGWYNPNSYPVFAFSGSGAAMTVTVYNWEAIEAVANLATTAGQYVYNATTSTLYVIRSGAWAAL